jgi:S1-C subfamily serine protease
MAEAGFSHVCPSCGRRVPRNVTTCRCGAALSGAAAGADDESTEATGGGSLQLIMVVVLGIAAITGAAYWTFMRPAAEPARTTTRPASRPAVASQPEPESTAAPAATAAPSASQLSGQAQAWNAAANLQPAAQPSTTSTAGAAPAGAVPAASTAPAGSIEEMVDRVMPAIVLIETTTGRGSGFFITRDTLITNVHVVQNDGYVTLRRMDGSTTDARVETRAPAFDIAILKVAQPSPAQAVIPMATAQGLRPGQEIIVIGSALGTLQNSVSRGIVSGLRTSGGATLVQTDAAVNPGNSGGPMLDRNGNVVGITTMGYKGAEGLNFGVAIDHARDLLEGRQTNLGSARGLTDIQSQSSSGSESDRQQQQGNDQLRARLGQMTSAAGQIDAGWQRFRKECFQARISGSYDREWFAVLVPRGMPADAAGGCTSYYSSLESNITQFKGLMQQLLRDARQAGVLPGTVRDALRQSRLEFDWDR